MSNSEALLGPLFLGFRFYGACFFPMSMLTKFKSPIFDYKLLEMQGPCIRFTAGTQVNEYWYEGTGGCMEIHIDMGEYGHFSAGDWNSAARTRKWFDSTCVLKKFSLVSLGEILERNKIRQRLSGYELRKYFNVLGKRTLLRNIREHKVK